MCVGVCMCAGVRGCVQVYIHVTCMWVGAGRRGCTYMYVGVCLCVQVCAVCAGVHGCVWKSAEVRGCLPVSVLDEFSEYLLETRVNTSADFNMYPIRIFFKKVQFRKVNICRYCILI